MYLYCPIGQYNENIVNVYSDFFGRALDVQSTIYVSSLIISEFYNSFIRLDFNIWKKTQSLDYKKDFRPTEQFQKTNQLVLRSIESRILGVSKRINEDFSTLSIENIIERVGLLDYNDSYYVELSKMYGLKIVTNDKDFDRISDDVTILSI